MFRLLILASMALIALGVLNLSTPTAEPASDEEVVIYRDEFGIPNIYGTTEEGVSFAMGYAQAEDRLEELLKQYRRAEGTMAEVFGPEHLFADYRQRLWRHRAVAEANYGKLPEKVRRTIEAYQAGIKAYMKEHPREVPAWAPDLHPWQVVALSRMIIWGWPEGDAGRDLLKAGVAPDPVEARGSNQWVVAPSRTAEGHALALIDPHLSWYGQFRFYEARLYGGELAVAGVAIPGLPLTTLGHNAFCSVAMTTGGPDAADVYEEQINPENPKQYRYDGEWRTMTTRQEVIRVKEGDKVVDKKVDIDYTHHGPVVARRRMQHKAFAMKLPYLDEFRLPEQAYRMATARNLRDMKKALSLFQLMEQNVMIATVDGDIFYVRNGRVPIRPAGYDWTRPVPGNTSKSEWRGFHPLEDLLQLENPWQGYMQNCNVSPEFMLRFSPLTPARYAERPYLYNPDNPLHQRAAMTLNQLHQNPRLTIDQAKDIAMSTEVFHADLWQAKLVEAWQGKSTDADVVAVYNQIVRWNRQATPDSTGAVAYRYWLEALGNKALDSARAGLPPPREITSAELLTALEKAASRLQQDWKRVGVKYGDVYKVGRRGSNKTWPVGGGSVRGLATPRAISFARNGAEASFVGTGGQTSVQLVQMSKPPRSWTLLPLGQSDRPDSRHFDDQAEKLFSPGKLKSTYFLDKNELLKNVSKKTTLRWKS